MGEAKKIRVEPISSKDASKVIKALHYSGKVVQNSQLHLGVFYNGKCGGALQFGPSLDKRKVQGLVKGTGWNEFIELNRMALADWLPKNGESRAIGYSMRFIKKNYPWIKWVISFSDATQCGDGIIYRASGFVLTGIKKNNQIWTAPTGETFSRMSLTDGKSKKQQFDAQRTISRTTVTKGKHVGDTGAASMKKYIAAGWVPLVGYQLRYLFFLHEKEKANLTVPVLPFRKIDELNARMYKGTPQCAQNIDGDVSGFQSEKGGSSPTCALQLSPNL